MNLKFAFPDGKFWVGIEGGIEIINHEMHAFAWMVVLDAEQQGEARTATFVLPPQIKELVNQGIELGHADDIVFNRKNSKQKDGAVGILTNGLINRTAYYKPAIILALIPFMNDGLF
jgi:inosine/xanthosine triphosphatase